MVMQWVKNAANRDSKNPRKQFHLFLYALTPTFDQCISVLMEQQIGVCIHKQQQNRHFLSCAFWGKTNVQNKNLIMVQVFSLRDVLQ